MIRQKLMRTAGPTDSAGFTTRGTQVSRLEGISDAVFGLAITLIVVTLKAPQSFSELLMTLETFIGSAACTLIIFQIWNRHYLYFRRFGLEDAATRMLNGVLLFVVIAYVYPLKFLFGAMFESLFKLHVNQSSMSWDDLPRLFIIYGTGFAAVYLIFSLMYLNALRQKETLQLSPVELLQTRWLLYEHSLLGSSGVLSILVAGLGTGQVALSAGFAYFVIPIFLTINGAKHGKALRKLRAELASNPENPEIGS